jgi:hypothetical protein
MQDKVTYEYAVIRLVPKVEREEFLNIGVIIFSKRKKYLGIKFEINGKRIAAFSCEPNGGAIGKFELSSRFRWLTASRSTIIQSSKTHPGLCHEPEKVLDELFERYVL